MILVSMLNSLFQRNKVLFSNEAVEYIANLANTSQAKRRGGRCPPPPLNSRGSILPSPPLRTKVHYIFN